MAPITQVAMFEPKADTTAEQSKMIFEEALAFQDKCLHPETQKPYLKSVVGGTGNIVNAVDGSQSGTTLVFIIEFANEEDRQFFIEKDAAHSGFIQRNVSHLAKAQVLPFRPGVF